jgi:hypothetical protein
MRKEFSFNSLSEVQLNLFSDVPSYSALLMEEFIRSKYYLEFKSVKANIDSVKAEFHRQLKNSEYRRHEMEEHNLVCKFVNKKIGNTDYEGLNEYLLDHYGVLFVKMAKVDSHRVKKDPSLLELVEPYQQPLSYYCSPSFNKKGKESTVPKLKKFEGKKTEVLAESLNNFLPISDFYKQQYEQLKSEMMKCTTVKRIIQTKDEHEVKKLKKQMKHEYGSLSVRSNKPSYDVEGIYKKYGEEFLIQYCKPDSTKLQQAILNGYVKEKEIEQFKTIVNIETEFVVMRLDVDRRVRDIFEKQRIQASLRRAN